VRKSDDKRDIMGRTGTIVLLLALAGCGGRVDQTNKTSGLGHPSDVFDGSTPVDGRAKADAGRASEPDAGPARTVVDCDAERVWIEPPAGAETMTVECVPRRPGDSASCKTRPARSGEFVWCSACRRVIVSAGAGC